MSHALLRSGGKGDWRPIETAPKDGTFVLLSDLGDEKFQTVCYFGGTALYAPRYDDADMWRVVWDMAPYPVSPVSRWHPLPEPSK